MILFRVLYKKHFINLLSTNRKMSNNALVFLAQGAEEMETVITVDVLRRAGVNVTLAGVNGAEPVLCSRNVRVVPDEDLNNVKDNTYDAVIIPGGLKGAETCANVSWQVLCLKLIFQQIYRISIV
jgi:protein DJ-1